MVKELQTARGSQKKTSSSAKAKKKTVLIIGLLQCLLFVQSHLTIIVELLKQTAFGPEEHSRNAVVVHEVSPRNKTNHTQDRSSLLLLETFSNVPLEPSAECNTSAANSAMNYICARPKNQRLCTQHARARRPPKRNGSPPESVETCKTLWFAGMFEGKNSACKSSNLGGYKREYAAALRSATLHAKDVLQPVLLLGRHGMENENSTELSKLGEWAQQNGAIVKIISSLSFQDLVVQGLGGSRDLDHLMGPFLRLDIPQVIERFNLWETPGVCEQHVLYTDSDVVFPNPITFEDMSGLKAQLTAKKESIVSYGRESTMNPHIVNTGIMVMDVPKFVNEWPQILRYGYKHVEKFPGHDQEWLNGYFGQSKGLQQKRDLLPIHWNWKVYWPLAPSTWEDIKVIHFHGPKPGRGLENIAHCRVEEDDWSRIPDAYKTLVTSGVCCDRGQTAKQAWQMYQLLQPNDHNIC